VGEQEPEGGAQERSPRRAPSTGRRRANATGGRRQHAHLVKVTAEEEARLQLRAGEQRVSVVRLLVESALAAGTETASQRQEAIATLFGIQRLLAAVSNNVNQVARHANATGEIPAEAAAALSAVRRVVERIDAAIDDLSLQGRSRARAELRAGAGRAVGKGPGTATGEVQGR
jgi:hypothetical protein